MSHQISVAAHSINNKNTYVRAHKSIFTTFYTLAGWAVEEIRNVASFCRVATLFLQNKLDIQEAYFYSNICSNYVYSTGVIT